MFSIGIGNATSSAELKAIASNPSYVFEVGDYQTLFTLDGVVAHRACGGTSLQSVVFMTVHSKKISISYSDIFRIKVIAKS